MAAGDKEAARRAMLDAHEDYRAIAGCGPTEVNAFFKDKFYAAVWAYAEDFLPITAALSMLPAPT